MTEVDEMLRGVSPEYNAWAQDDRAANYATSASCHPEGSEGSVALGSEMLRCAECMSYQPRDPYWLLTS
jgi:hypothetical protein